MVVSMGTNNDEMEVLKALTGGKPLKDLLGRKTFEIQEMYILLPEEGVDEDGRTQVAIKVDGRYYKGISERVVKTAQQIISWRNNIPLDKDVPAINAVLEKSSGRYGTFELILQ